MPTELNSVVYPFDPTGTAATNKIVGEQQVITAANHRDFHFIVPSAAPYFADSLVVVLRALDNSVRPLVEGIDYYCTHQFIAASRACAKPIYGSISFLDAQLVGAISIGYQTVGGIWTLNLAQITEILSNRLRNPRITSWEQVADVPTLFPVIDHQWNLADLVGAREVVSALDNIVQALLITGDGAIPDHILNLQNPHEVTAAQIGLGNVRNFATATQAQAIAGTSDDLYVTPLGVARAVLAQVGTPFAAHSQNVENPHQVTAAQVGTYTSTEIDGLLDAIRNSGLAATDTIKFDQKTPTEFAAWVLTGTSANSIKFAGATYQEAYDSFRSNIPVANISGAYSTSQVNSLLLGKLATNGVAADSAKLEGRTFAQVLADISGAVTSSYYTALQMDTALNGKLDSGATAADTIKFGNKTYAEAYAEFRTNIPVANVSGAYSTIQIDQFLGGKLDTEDTAFDSARLGGKTPSEVKADILLGKADDTFKFNGMDSAQLQQFLSYQIVTGVTAAQSVVPKVTLAGAGANVWVKLGTLNTVSVIPNTKSETDAQLLVTGGDAVAGSVSGTFLVRVSTRGAVAEAPASMQVLNLTGTAVAGRFGLVVVNEIVSTVLVTQVVEVWMEIPSLANEVVVTLLSRGQFEPIHAAVPVIAEPTDIVYTTAKTLVTDDVATQLRTDLDALTAVVEAM